MVFKEQMRFQFQHIYVQKKVLQDLLWSSNAQKVIGQFPEAQIHEVESHWQLPELFEASPKNWIETKNKALVLGIKSQLENRENGRSADFIAASISNGCLSSCQYCYVARRKGGSNPLTLFMNVDQIADSIEQHQKQLGPKRKANQTDPHYWTYDIGCNADLSLDAMVCDHPRFMIERFSEMEFAKATFATKSVNDEYWLSIDPKRRTRIRYSIMPTPIARSVDIRTSPISERIQSTNRLVDAGYEVHYNFSPIIMYGGDQWKKDWVTTLEEISDVLTENSKKQLDCEAFFLTHSHQAHELNLEWNPKGEEFLWSPSLQVPKRTQPDVIVYDYDLRRRELGWFQETLKKHLPDCKIRYSF
jgi:DNA repair photolyase